MARRLLIHPGFHKTGTTWLQNRVFGASGHFHPLFSHDEVDRIFLEPHDLRFSAEHAGQAIAEARGAEDARIDVISSEILSGDIFAGSARSKLLADRLAASTGGEAKILLTVRAQQSFAQSLYIQYVKRGGRLPARRFFDPRCEPGFAGFSTDTLQFGWLAAHYATQFGAANVLVLPLELLARDRAAYLGHLAQFAGLEPGALSALAGDDTRDGVSPPASGLGLIRCANLFRETPLNPNALRGLAPLGALLHRAGYHWKLGAAAARTRLAQAVADRVSGRFAQSNRELQALCPVDLAGLGYET